MSSDFQEGARRRREMIKGCGLPRLRLACAEARGRELDRPIVCILHASAGAGYVALQALGETDGEAIWTLPFSDVMQLAQKCAVPGLSDALEREVRADRFVILCLAYDGWTMTWPDEPGDWEKTPATPLGGNVGLRAFPAGKARAN